MKKKQINEVWYDHTLVIKSYRIMRLTLGLLLIIVTQGWAINSYSQKTTISLDLKNTDLVSVMDEIEKQTNFYFLFNYEQVNSGKKIDVKLSNTKIEETLNIILQGTDLKYSIKGRQIVINKDGSDQLNDQSISSTQQQKSVSGKVTDSSGLPLPGVSVVIKGTTKGNITDSNGDYTLSNVSGDAILQFSFIGMKSQEFVVGNKNMINVTLEEGTVGIEEVVAIGYGTMKKIDMTGSVVSFKTDEIIKMPSTRVDVALQGKMAGVVISNDKGQPGEDPVIRIRGNNSIVGDNAPLIVVDGVLGAQMSTINPNEIATVDVLKDASATAIYGSQGANGVIIITTKRGKTGETKFDFNSYLGFSQLTKTMEMMSAQEQVDFLKTAPTTHPAYRLFQEFLALYDPPAANVDWMDVIMRTGLTQNYFLSASGGKDKTRFSISGSILSQDGIIKASDYERQTFRANFDQEVTDKLKFGINLNMSRTVQNNSRVDEVDGSILTTALKFSPAIPVYDAEGNYSSAYPLGENIDNPMALLKERIDENTGFSMQLNAFAEYEIFKNLSFRTSYNYHFGNYITNHWSGKALKEASGIGTASISSGNTNSWLTDNILTFDKEFGIHKLTVMGGFTASGYNSPGFSASGNTFPTESLKYYSLELADPSTYKINSGITESTLASYLGRVNYVLSNKYLFTVNFRADGSSKFAKNNKWGYFPSGAVGWRVSEEGFMKSIPQISNLKLRLSYGVTGSQAIDPYESLASFTGEIANFGTGAYTAIRLDKIPNPNLRWETTEQTDAGIDLGLFDNRISVVADYYIKNTFDLLYTKQIPSYTGYSSQVQNIGNVRNEGVELGLNTVNLNKGLKWNTSFNISFNRNTVLDLGGDLFTLYNGASGASIGNQSSILKVGEPMGSFFGYIFDGIYQNQAECDALPYPSVTECKPGMVKLKDIADAVGNPVPDGKITPEDRTILGNGQPDFTFGFGNDFSYKNFDLNIMFQGVYGNEIMNISRAGLEEVGTLTGLRSMIGAYWDGEGSTNAREMFGEEHGPTSSRWIEDGSYLRLKNVSLGYTLNKNLLKHSGIDNLRIYISGTNIWTLTNYSGFDPEINSNSGNLLLGYDYGGYPTAKTYTIGVNLGF